MEDRIRLLPENIANQIAAGEVVNHASSAIKEMMENSIDAGATEVIVNYRKSGLELIQIVDNGVGMSPNDARMSFERHATSKIRSASDIYALNTFGFRGEALASIASVARVELKSRTEDSEMGTLTIIDNGEFIEQRCVMCEKGSQFAVKNLFLYIPARRRYAEKQRSSTAASLIKEEFRRVALCHPDKSFELYDDDKLIYKLTPTTLAGRIVEIIGGEKIKKNLLETHASTVIVNISGYICHPDGTKKSPEQYLFVNGRFFKSAYLNRAIQNCYEGLAKPKTQPSFFLFLEVDPDQVDVNIHPQKTEVKFLNDSAIWQILSAAIKETLARTGAMPLMEFNNESNIEIPVLKQGVSYAEPQAVTNSSYNPFEVEQQHSEVVRQEFAERDDSEYDTIPSAMTEQKRSSTTSRTKSLQSATYSDLEQSWESDFETFESIESERNTTPIYDDYIASEQVVEIEEWDDLHIEESEDTPCDQDLELPTQVGIVKDIDLSDVTVTNGHYAWCKIGSNMNVIDLRRAKERLLYNHYITILRSGERVSQKILFPITLTLSDEEYNIMRESAMEFTLLGFDVEYGESNRVEISGLPADVTTDNADRLIYEMLQTLSTPENISTQQREHLAKVMARNGAQTVGRSMISTQLAKELIDQLLKSGDMGCTPSGKTILWSVTREDIKRHIK